MLSDARPQSDLDSTPEVRKIIDRALTWVIAWYGFQLSAAVPSKYKAWHPTVKSLQWARPVLSLTGYLRGPTIHRLCPLHSTLFIIPVQRVGLARSVKHSEFWSI